jgi:hypothetical protein
VVDYKKGDVTLELNIYILLRKASYNYKEPHFIGDGAIHCQPTSIITSSRRAMVVYPPPATLNT